jgi:hypothetical protein
MKRWPVVAVAFLFAIAVPYAYAQEGEKEAPKGTEPQEDEDELTPAQAMELLEDAHRMMGKAEELLNDSSRGKALETEKALMERLQRELKDEPDAMQQRILAKVGKLVEKAEKKEKDAAEKLNEIIKKAKT